MQLHNWFNAHNLNASSSPADSDDASAVDQGSFMNGAADASLPSGAKPQEYLMNAAGEISPVSAASAPSINSGAGGASGAPPAPTLVGSASGLQFELIWDASVAAAPRGFVQAVVDAAKLYSSLFSNKEVIAIDVGFGEIAGAPLAPDALGQSASFGYLTDYPTVTSVLQGDGFRFPAANEPTDAQFFITSADAKTMGLVDPVAGLDGFVGFSDLSGIGFSWNTRGTATGPTQFDLQAVAEHEISEVMGRLGFGGVDIAGQPTYTPLDLFDYQSKGVLALSPNGGYFSVDNGRTNLGNFNDAAQIGGDIGDWASFPSSAQAGTIGLNPRAYDAYDAFTFPGQNGQVSLSDVIEDAALGYRLAPTAGGALLANYLAAGFAGASGPHGGAVIASQDSPAPSQQLFVGASHG
jgi:hypothetical protein